MSICIRHSSVFLYYEYSGEKNKIKNVSQYSMINFKDYITPQVLNTVNMKRLSATAILMKWLWDMALCLPDVIINAVIDYWKFEWCNVKSETSNDVM